MGHMKDIMIDNLNDERDKKIAELLGLTFDELSDLDYSFETDESEDGLIYNYRIEFAKNSSKRILKKIKKIFIY